MWTQWNSVCSDQSWAHPWAGGCPIARVCPAAGLLGVRASLAGIGPMVASTIVELDMSAMRRVKIFATAGEAIAQALRR